MYHNAMRFEVLGINTENRPRVLEWSPLSTGCEKKAETIASWASELDEALDSVKKSLPHGYFVALIDIWSSQGMEDWDTGEHLLAVRSIPPIEWRHLLGELRVEFEETDHARRKRESEEHEAYFQASVAREESDGARQPTQTST